jgi:tRNA nucleotidyltransferase (CCA-adding enzyme)
MLVVGGAVRDRFLEKDNPRAAADLDLVVFGLSFERVLELLGRMGRPMVLKRGVFLDEPRFEPLIHFRSRGRILDVTLPAGEPRPFSPERLKEDARRRDFTLNALYMDPLSGEILDPLGGLEDVLNRRLVPASEDLFERDPLRLLRAFSLISRRSLTAHPDLLRLSRKHRDLLKLVSKDRFWPEWRSWAASGDPHLGLGFLDESGLLSLFPELMSLKEHQQGWHFHPEGSVWNHTLLVVREISRLRLPERSGHSFDRGILVLAALTHDIGKNAATRVRDPESGRIHYPGHAPAGVPLARSFLKSVMCPGRVSRPVLKLVRWHMEGAFSRLGTGDLRRLARDLAPEATLAELWALKAADWNGRLYWPESYPHTLEDFLEPVGGSLKRPEDLISGGEMKRLFGLEEGPELGRLKNLVREAHDQEVVSTREEALRLVSVHLRETGAGAREGV